MVFLPSVAADAAAGRGVVADAIAAQGLEVAGWRRVPIDRSVLGPSARAACPRIEQVIVAAPRAMRLASFEAALLLARRDAEWSARERGLDDLAVVSMSSRTIVYKGLFVGGELGRFYRDLADPTLAVAYAVFHQRYSTNTHPSWRLAQPFRFLAHNGEINTVRGNREAMRGRAGDARRRPPRTKPGRGRGARPAAPRSPGLRLDVPGRGGRAARGRRLAGPRGAAGTGPRGARAPNPSRWPTSTRGSAKRGPGSSRGTARPHWSSATAGASARSSTGTACVPRRSKSAATASWSPPPRRACSTFRPARSCPERGSTRAA